MIVNIKSNTLALILSLEGELTLHNRDAIQEKLNSFLEEDKNMIIEGTDLTYVDSSGLGLFLEINNKLKQKGLQSLVFANLVPVVRRSLEVTHLAQIMPIYNSEGEAIAGFTQSWNWQVPSQLVYVKSLSYKVRESLSALNLDKYLLSQIRLCIEETMINAIKHGNKSERTSLVTVGYKLENHQLEISVSDEGEGFDTAIRGKGLSLIFNFMDEVRFNERGNAITMIKKV